MQPNILLRRGDHTKLLPRVKAILPERDGDGALAQRGADNTQAHRRRDRVRTHPCPRAEAAATGARLPRPRMSLKRRAFRDVAYPG